MKTSHTYVAHNQQLYVQSSTLQNKGIVIKMSTIVAYNISVLSLSSFTKLEYLCSSALRQDFITALPSTSLSLTTDQ